MRGAGCAPVDVREHRALHVPVGARRLPPPPPAKRQDRHHPPRGHGGGVLRLPGVRAEHLSEHRHAPDGGEPRLPDGGAGDEGRVGVPRVEDVPEHDSPGVRGDDGVSRRASGHIPVHRRQTRQPLHDEGRAPHSVLSVHCVLLRH